MEQAEMRRRLERAPVGRLATIGPGGPHLVPVCFALVEDYLYSAVDQKPKTTLRLQRLANLERYPRASLLVDHYEEDWTRLWWVRVDGRSAILRGSPQRDAAVAQLKIKYRQYQEEPPDGPVIAISIERWIGWEAAVDPPKPPA